MDTFTPNTTITIIGAIIFFVYTLYKITEMIIINAKH